MIRDIAKVKRARLASILVKSGANRTKAKKLIRYPEMKSIQVKAVATGATFDIKLRDGNELFDISQNLNADVSSQSVRVDPSKKESNVEVALTQPGSAWSSGDVVIETRFDDGVTSKKLIAPNSSGDGTGTVVPLEISDNIPSPSGWPKF
jgi:hypothetical protein